MPPQNTQYRKPSRMRFIKAYGATLSILFRYLTLTILARFISSERSEILFSQEHDRTAKKITKTLLELKGIYIKIGQTLSIMGNFLPARFTEGLESLQDAVPAHPFQEVQECFRRDFDMPAEEIFASIETTPIASASLGQVHVAYAKTGEKLAVKIQYPDIDAITRLDLKTIRHIFSLMHLVFPQYNLKNVYEECAAVVLRELDYRREAENMEQIARNAKDNPLFIFPKFYREYSSEKVLTTAFIDGAKITDLKKIETYSIQKSFLARELINFYCKQIFLDGFYHADPHPGNIIVTPQGKVAMIDFGAVSSVSAVMRSGLTQFVEGIIKRDTKTLGGALKQMGFIAKGDNDETLDKVVAYFYSKISSIKIENFKNLNISQFHEINDLVELRKMDISLKDLASLFLIPREWVMLERTMLLMMGLTAQLDAQLNPMDIIVPYAEAFLLGKDKSLKDFVLAATKELILSYINLPGEIEKTLKKLHSGHVTITVKDMKKELSGIRRGLAMLGSVVLAAVSGLLSQQMSVQGMAASAFRFELVFYAFVLLFFFLLIKR